MKTKEKLRIDLRKKYPGYFKSYDGKILSAQHRFIDDKDYEHGIVLAFDHEPNLVSFDNGKSWDNMGAGIYPPCNRGIYRFNNQLIAIDSGTHLQRSFDGGRNWLSPEKIPSADDVHYKGLEGPNVFSVIMTTQKRIVIAADNFLGQEGPNGQLLSVVSSGDGGRTWIVSRLFGPTSPLPPEPEGFGEPAVVEMPSGRLWMVFRTPYGELWQCISRDGGISWNDPTPTGLSSPIANCYAKRLPDSGATVLCFNLTKPNLGIYNLAHPRTNLVFMVSHDNCRTWSCPVTVEEKGGFYPTIHFSETDMFIMYQSNPDYRKCGWEKYGLTLVAYDKKEVDSLPAWTAKTIQLYIDQGLVAHWLALACDRPFRETSN